MLGAPGQGRDQARMGVQRMGLDARKQAQGPRSPAGGQAGGFLPLSSGGPGRETVGSSSSTWQVDPPLQGGWITWAFELPFRAQSH